MSFDFSQFLVFDALVAAGVIVASFAFMYTFGKYSTVPAFAALGFAAACSLIVPFVGHVPVIAAWPEYQQRIVGFVVVLLVAYTLFRRHVYFEPTSIPNGIELLVCSVMFGGLILTIVGSFLPIDVVATLSPHVRVVFVDDLPKTLWLLSPLVVFGAMKGR